MDIDYDDLLYRGISDVSQLIYPIVIDMYYLPELIDSSFDGNYERYQIIGNVNKELSIIDYLNSVRQNVEDY